MKILIAIFVFELFSFSFFEKKDQIERITRSVVNIEVFSFQYSYESPWQQPKIQSSSGSGFVISFKNQKKILTNAHVVSNAFQIRIKRVGQNQFYFAKVEFIAHDCDLALLDVIQNSKEFYQDAEPLEIGDLPKLNSPVTVIGFPIGGNKVSITKGIVSRVDMDTYSHSGIDSHLVIQVDAAINPGNSGGPAIQNGKVIGVAFQILRSGENLGYLIPTSVIRKFLNDIQDGKYNGYIELGVLYQTLENPMMKNALKLPKEFQSNGVYIYDIMPNTSSEGYLKPGDILLEIQGYPITNHGEVWIKDEYRNFVELIDNLEEGEIIQLKILRNQQILNINLKAKTTNYLDFQRKDYDTPPEYVVFYGLVFQPLNHNLLSTYSSVWFNHQASNIFYYYYYAIQNRTSLNRKQIIILTKVLSDHRNFYYKEFTHYVVKSINNRQVENLKMFYQILQEESKKNLIIFEFEGKEKKLIIQAKHIQNINQEILKNYGIKKDFFIKEF